MRTSVEVHIEDEGVTKTFIIEKLGSTWHDKFVTKALKVLVDDKVVYPEDITRGDVLATIFTLVQNGKDADGKIDLTNLMSHALPILKSAYANLDEEDRVDLINRLLTTVTYKNGQINSKLDYDSIDLYIDDFKTIYKICWQAIIVNFNLLSAGNK